MCVCFFSRKIGFAHGFSFDILVYVFFYTFQVRIIVVTLQTNKKPNMKSALSNFFSFFVAAVAFFFQHMSTNSFTCQMKLTHSIKCMCLCIYAVTTYILWLLLRYTVVHFKIFPSIVYVVAKHTYSKWKFAHKFLKCCEIYSFYFIFICMQRIS